MNAQMSKISDIRRPPSCCPQVEDLLDPAFFRALGDPNRIAILAHMARCAEPCSVSRMAECCPVDLSVVSRHLAVLRDAGILEARKQGRKVLYSVRHPELVRTLRSMADAIEACCRPEGEESKG
jgi:ArsR family transcriptional regulator